MFLILCGCLGTGDDNETVSMHIKADGIEKIIQITPGITVKEVLETHKVAYGNIDRIEPPLYTVLNESGAIQIFRVREEFLEEEKVIPFDHQTVRNESLAEGQSFLLQPGVNGVQQITYRILYEEGKETTRTVLRTVNKVEAQPEIVMVGVQRPFASLEFPGKLAYLTAGNAWVMEQSSGNRKAVVTTGDLDGRIFQLSANRQWLLFTRKEANQNDGINSLWIGKIEGKENQIIQVEKKNIIHYAEWVPARAMTIAYSTVEPRSTPPGWQANNDLHLLTLTESGTIVRDEEIITPNAGGIYGWWGTVFAWSRDGKQVAYARPDSVGLIDLKEKKFVPLLREILFQTRSDWAWTPALEWSENSRTLITTYHNASEKMTTAEESPDFDLSAILMDTGNTVHFEANCGMFANPAASPMSSGRGYKIAYLSAIDPEQSASSRYRLMLMDRDGSNRQVIFPPDDSSGLDPQKPLWSPSPMGNNNTWWLAILQQNNLWLVDPTTRKAHQITGDGLVIRIDWR